MTTPEQRRQHWEGALRAWNGAQDALDGALARYVEGDPAIAAGVLARHIQDALRSVAIAAAQLQEKLDDDVWAAEQEEQEP